MVVNVTLNFVGNNFFFLLNICNSGLIGEKPQIWKRIKTTKDKISQD